jgi:hypothetical protein
LLQKFRRHCDGNFGKEHGRREPCLTKPDGQNEALAAHEREGIIIERDISKNQSPS